MAFWSLDENNAELRIEGEIVSSRDILAWFLGEPQAIEPEIVREIRSVAGKKLTVWINSPGGSAIAGSVIYTALRNHTGGVIVKIDGIAASAAATIAAAGDVVLMSPTAAYMIHNPATEVSGDASDLRKAIHMLNSCKAGILSLIHI